MPDEGWLSDRKVRLQDRKCVVDAVRRDGGDEGSFVGNEQRIEAENFTDGSAFGQHR